MAQSSSRHTWKTEIKFRKEKTNCRERERFVFYFLLFTSFKEKSIRLLCCTTSGIDERVEREKERRGGDLLLLFLFLLESTTPFAVKRPELTIQRDSSITSLFISSFLVAVFILSPWPRREENDLEPYKIIREKTDTFLSISFFLFFLPFELLLNAISLVLIKSRRRRLRRVIVLKILYL